ncbi:FAD:protein FMN transferase [Pleionea sp. CnH1-48]|uniref:FAD:protein FMN transferase n=1 Tax=Pleionea sp. CnH1-48 TaxID=2954494 RepID=UPI0020984FE0|nr:FAD:protein FMN transferase [Pleionea sp. CnH1-48]MCO7223063.1 FAD:protein FMN transferase [Pleionea sp. CnH1-48]
MKYSTRIASIILMLASFSAAAQWHSKRFEVMGTEANVELWHKDARKAQTLITAVMDEMERINQLMSPYIETSELSRINQLAAEKPQKISEEMFLLLTQSADFSKESNGAFDITYASVGHLFNYREQSAPEDSTIKEHQPLIDYKSVVLEAEKSTVSFTKPGVKIDLGGIAKGHAVDRCIELLAKSGVEHAFVNAGGDSRVLGDRKGRLWTVGIQHPRKKGEVLTRIPVENVAISTSGDYERFFIRNGERIHHIIDPNTGKSAKKSISVSIIADNALTSDALSTTVFVLGPKKGLELINKLDKVSAIIIDEKGQYHYSKDLQSQ